MPSFIRFIPTPSEDVPVFADMARLSPSDVVYDLGSGDGRLIFAAIEISGRRLSSFFPGISPSAVSRILKGEANSVISVFLSVRSTVPSAMMIIARLSRMASFSSSLP